MQIFSIFPLYYYDTSAKSECDGSCCCDRRRMDDYLVGEEDSRLARYGTVESGVIGERNPWNFFWGAFMLTVFLSPFVSLSGACFIENERRRTYYLFGVLASVIGGIVVGSMLLVVSHNNGTNFVGLVDLVHHSRFVMNKK